MHFSSSPYTLKSSGTGWATVLGCWVCVLSSLFLATPVSRAQITLSEVADVSSYATRPGFRWRVFANSAHREDSIQRAESALAGTLMDVRGEPEMNLADPNAVGAAEATGAKIADFGESLVFFIPGVINLSRSTGSSEGNFPNDTRMPGLPATNGSSDGVSAEVFALLELPEGTTTMGINSDDGFRIYGGIPFDVLEWRLLGSFEGGRSASNTLFSFKVPKAGVYPFRVVYEQGTHDASIEWFTINSDGTQVLVNDLQNGGVRAFSELTCQGFPHPRVVAVSPNPTLNQSNQPLPRRSLVLADGAITKVKDSHIPQGPNNQAYPIISDVSREGNLVRVHYTSTGFVSPHEVMEFSTRIPISDGSSRQVTWDHMNLENLLLTNPIVSENFESYAEGAQPTGWSAVNYTASCVKEYGTSNIRSETYRNWVVVSSSTLSSVEDEDVSQVNFFQRLNGDALTIDRLRSGNVLYAASNGRCNGINRRAVLVNRSGSHGQVQFIESAPFNLSRMTNVVLSFGAGYKQNEDSLGGVEYSVNGGTNWLPVVYYLDDSRILRNSDGAINAVDTFNAIQDDTALWVDSVGLKGERFGDALKATISSNLDAYIAPRLNDDGSNGKRIEAFRLPNASKKSDVRLRFIATGSDSWYFFVDNIQFHDIGTNSPATSSNNPPLSSAESNPRAIALVIPPVGIITASTDGSVLHLNWSGGSGRYLVQRRLGMHSNWVDFLSTTNQSLSTPVSVPTQFFRIVDPDGTQ